ncbi:hypothetical protein [Micromonospora saelicesensis]|uniref:hypothetical protein n=1 Tax=Micromonospora saelicesensis TaxID=285676 RepID=UPI000DC5E52B|nr:hypothetical protein [Micromonospora saelicesensis]RAO58956.1 hypothetical protein PSN01_02816 [Micromonospora saelicesensis]
MSTEFVIELPDELADRLAEEPDISAFVTECVRKDMADERILHTLRQAGFALSPAHLKRARRVLNAALEQITPELGALVAGPGAGRLDEPAATPGRSAFVLDTPALLAFAGGDENVAARIAVASDRRLTVVIPAGCLASAYRHIPQEGWWVLDLLAALRPTQVMALTADCSAALGLWLRSVPAVDLAQAAMEAARGITPIMTDRRELLGEVLPKEWPIIDL